MRLASLRVAVLTAAFYAVPLMVYGQGQTLTSKTTTQAIEGHQLIITVLSKGSKAQEDSAVWWKWGNTTDDTYLFALDRPSNVRFALIFAAGKPGRQATLIYARKDQPPMSLQQNGKLTTLGDVSLYPHLVMTTPASDWVINGQASYQLKLVGDGVAGLESITSTPDGTPDFIREVTPDAAGFPARDETTVVQNPFPNRGYPRYGLNQRVGLSAPFKTLSPLMATFPYIGAGQIRTNWFISNPNPIYFNVSSGEMQFFPFTGFQTAGMYGINSLRGDIKDFETVFALYSLRSAPPYADMVIRSRNFPAGDTFGPKPITIARNTFRYSWKTLDPALWTYSLGFAGQGSVISNDTDATSIAQNYNNLPTKMTNTNWPAISFIQAMNGYPGSEGIYHYTAQDDEVWQSFQANPPTKFVLGSPIFQTDTNLRAKGEHTLPLNFRGEYLFGLPRKPLLYRDEFDGLVHLLGAQEGFWYKTPQQYLHTLDLNKDGYVDSYQECELLSPIRVQADSSSVPISCTTQLIRLSNSAVLIENDRVLVKPDLNNLERLPVPIPTTTESWRTFMDQAGQAGATSGRVADLWSRLPGDAKLISTRTTIATILDSKTGHLTLILKTLPEQKNKLVVFGDGSTVLK